MWGRIVTIYVRHSKVYNPAKLCYGQSQMPLDDSYPSELQELQQNLSKHNFSRIYSSPLARCTKLAEDLLPQFKVHIDSRLMELDFGQWEQKAWDDIPRKEIDYWAEDYVNRAPPEGESFLQLISRVRDFHESLDGTKHLVFCHAGVIRAMMFICGQVATPRESFDRELAYCGMWEFK